MIDTTPLLALAAELEKQLELARKAVDDANAIASARQLEYTRLSKMHWCLSACAAYQACQDMHDITKVDIGEL